MPHRSGWRQFPRHRRPSTEAGRGVFPERVGVASNPSHVFDALEEDLDRVHVARSSEFVVLVQNIFALLDSTARDTEDFMSTALDGSGVDADDAPVQIHMELSRARPHKRFVLVPQSEGTPGSVPAQSDVVLPTMVATGIENDAVCLAVTMLQRMSKVCKGTVSSSFHRTAVSFPMKSLCSLQRWAQLR